MGLKIGTVTLEKYNSNWIKMFEDEKENLEKYFGEYAKSIEHIGSTAIEGIYAKPIIDIAIGIDKLEFFENVRKHFLEEPYSIKDNYECDEILIRRRTGDVTNYLIHVMEIEGKRYNNTIKFRDYVREHKEVLKQYEDLKKELAKKYANNREKYTASKNDFIQEILKKSYEENK